MSSVMSERERFLWDLQGYLVIEGVLTVEEVAVLNASVDANQDKMNDHHKGGLSPALEGSPRQIMAGMFQWEPPHNGPWRNLIAHPRLIPYLNTTLGPGWRMDQEPFVFLANTGAEGLLFHGPGHTLIGEGFSYEYAHGRMRSGMITVEFHLSDQDEGDGGFACIPGSHKSEIRCPDGILGWETDRNLVVNPGCRSGDVLIFNEATIHGTLPWTAPHQRRAALYRYSPKYMQLGGGLVEWTWPEWTEELTEAQRSVLRPPSILAQAVLDDEGRLVDPAAPPAG